MVKNLISVPLLACLAQLLTPWFFFLVLQLLDVNIAVSYHRMQFQGKLNQIQAQENDQKTSFWAWFWFVGPLLFLFQKSALSVTRYYGQLSLCTIADKTNDPYLRKFRDGRKTGRRTDRETEIQTDGREWFYRTLSN